MEDSYHCCFYTADEVCRHLIFKWLMVENDFMMTCDFFVWFVESWKTSFSFFFKSFCFIAFYYHIFFTSYTAGFVDINWCKPLDHKIVILFVFPSLRVCVSVHAIFTYLIFIVFHSVFDGLDFCTIMVWVHRTSMDQWIAQFLCYFWACRWSWSKNSAKKSAVCSD